MNSDSQGFEQKTPSSAKSRWAGGRPAPRLMAIVLVAALCAAGALLVYRPASPDTAVAHATANSAPTLELLPDEVAEARVRELQPSILLTGTIRPLTQTEIKSQQAGEIREVLVREGESVRRGQIVAKLDTAELDAKLRDKLGALAVGKAQLALAKKNLATNASLLQRNFISQNAFDGVQNSYQIGAATLDSLRAQVEQARKARADAVIRAPIDGVVANAWRNRGSRLRSTANSSRCRIFQ